MRQGPTHACHILTTNGQFVPRPLVAVANIPSQSSIGNWQHWNWQHSHIGNISAPARWGEPSSASRRLVFTSPTISPPPHMTITLPHDAVRHICDVAGRQGKCYRFGGRDFVWGGFEGCWGKGAHFRAGLGVGSFIPAFARCCFCIAASLLVFTSPIQ